MLDKLEGMHVSKPIGEKIIPPRGYQPTNAAEVLPWSHARQRLAAAENYWLATTRRDGSPHVAPV
jgi:hypothetical protein